MLYVKYNLILKRALLLKRYINKNMSKKQKLVLVKFFFIDIQIFETIGSKNRYTEQLNK